MIVVDSSVWIANIREQDRPAVAYLRAVSRTTELIVGDIVLMEVLRGARNDRHARDLESALRQFRVESMLDANAAVEAAHHYRALRRDGITIHKVPDLLIATFCILRGYPLLHDDRDFEPFGTLGLEFVI